MDKDFAEDSDSSDEDYIPNSKTEEVVSEEESDGAVDEDPLSDTETNNKNTSTKRRRGKKSINKTKKLKKISEENVQNDEETSNSNTQKDNEMTEEERKKKVDELWADFLQDTNFKTKNPKTTTKISAEPVKKETAIKPVETQKKIVEKVKITEVFEFAGEEIKVEKEVPKNSAEARLSSTSSNVKSKKGGSLSGISSVLSQLGKKKKISVLEKTKLDWDRFKKDENLEEELTAHNKGKDGYLERQDFLQRADLRRFEIEKEIRAVERNKRMNFGGEPL